MFAASRRRTTLIATALAATLPGCAALSGLINSPSNGQLILQVAVEATASALVEASPAGSRAGTALAVTQAAQAMQAVATDNTVTLSQLEAQLAARLSMTHLSAQQQVLASQLIGAIVQIIAGKLQSGVLNAAQTQSVVTVLNWVIAGVAPYTTSTARRLAPLHVAPHSMLA